uniref:UFM1-specific peptidase 1 n=1 Tax=Gadus morhua TaxID=8049 RepID=A0A8C4ZUM4_GADMO
LEQVEKHPLLDTCPIDWGTDHNQGLTNGSESLLRRVHSGLDPPDSRCSIVSGDYLYYHYGCDGQDDRGWGCGYRTVQTMASWLCFSRESGRPPPSLPDIQQALVSMGDKEDSFRGSRGWIGTFEASLVLDFFYDVPCRVVHVRGGGAELEEVAVQELHRHFETHGSPVMMGGDRDNSSKGILGVCSGKHGSSVLVVDPHYYGKPLEKTELQTHGWVRWIKVSSLDQCSFYNLCLPLTGKRHV